MQKIEIRLPFNQDIEAYLREKYPTLQEYRILSKGLDARGASRGKVPYSLYQIQLIFNQEELDAEKRAAAEERNQSFPPLGEATLKEMKKNPPIIVGAGPAGLFCALRLLEYGVPSLIIERGDRAEDRMLKIARFWRYGEFDPESNVCYGEGGAGLFSDGKLLTRVKSPHISYVMKRFVDFGAPAEIQWMSDPHLGSNKIRKLIGEISQSLVAGGCQIMYRTCVEEILFNEKKVRGVRLREGQVIESPYVILAMGHSAKNVYEFLFKSQVAMKPKSFAMGFRIEHPRTYMDQLQYGDFAGDPQLGTARYSVRHTDKSSERGAYSFCMCPGGYVLSSGTEANGLVVNGMSNYSRHSPWSNGALVVTVKAGEDFAKDEKNPENVLDGLRWQLSIEQKAFEMAKARSEESLTRAIPAMSVKDYMAGRISTTPMPKTSCPSGVVKGPLHHIYPQAVNEHLRVSLEVFNRQIPGFISDKALLLAPETRTSAPITVIRDPESGESISHENLYPCGEGAGYAGGITSAAVDGIKIAERLVRKMAPHVFGGNAPSESTSSSGKVKGI